MTLDDLIKSSEALRLSAYDDVTGNNVAVGDVCLGTITIGWGHTGPDVRPGMTITEEEAERLFQQDKHNAILDAIGALTHIANAPDCWAGLGEPRQAALADMSFNLGRVRFAGFHKLLAAVAAGDWDGASDEVLYNGKPNPSKWKKQVKHRADRDAYILRTGLWPEHL